MPDLSLLFAFWSPETSFNWNLIAGWVLAMVIAKGFFPKVLERLQGALLKLLNKLPLLADTDLDEQLFEVLHRHFSTKVLAQMPAAREIKHEYLLKIEEALKAQDGEKVRLYSAEMRQKLEGLTAKIKDDFFADGESLLWQKLTERYGDKAKAGKWVYEKIKALVEELKGPDHPSTSAVIAKHLVGAAGEMGNVLLTGGSET